MGKVLIPETLGVIGFYAKEMNDLPKGTDPIEAMKTVHTSMGIINRRVRGEPLEEVIKGTPYEIGEEKPTNNVTRPVRAFDELGLG